MDTRKSAITEIIKNVRREKPISFSDDFFSSINTSTYDNLKYEQLISEIYNHIILIRVKIDRTHDIQSDLVTLQNGEKAYVRYADFNVISNAELNQQKIAAYNYLRIFYAYLLAAIAISKIYKFDSLNFAKEVYHIKKITTDTFNKYLATGDDDLMFRCVSEGKLDLIKLMVTFHGKFTQVSISEMLDDAKDWVALDEPSVPVYTVIKANETFSDKTIVVVEEPCCQLTREQLELFTGLKEQKWFKELTSFQQNLVMHYKNQIQSGTSLIPSRLRGIVPLNKNAFKESIWIADTSNELELINAYYHTGTVAHVGRKNTALAQQITVLNLLQQQQECQSHAMVMICLNSQLADYFIQKYEWLNGREYVGDDSEILSLTQAAAATLSDRDIYYAKICLNGFRMLEYNDYSGIDKIISILNANLLKLDVSLSSVNQFKNIISNLEKIRGQYTIIDYYVKGIDIIHLLSLAATTNNYLAETFPDKQLKNVDIWFGCASGENRTGITYYHNICASIIHYYEDKANIPMSEQSKKEIFEMIAKSQHVLVMTGYQGTTFGTDGIRAKSSGSLKDCHPKMQLVTKTSDIKALPVRDANFDDILDRLLQAIKYSQLNIVFKSFMSIVQMYTEHAKARSSNVEFFSDMSKNFYIDIMYALEKYLLAQNTSLEFLNSLGDIQKKLRLFFGQNNRNKAGNIIELDGLLARLIKEVSNNNILMPRAHLASQGLFNHNDQNRNIQAANDVENIAITNKALPK